MIDEDTPFSFALHCITFSFLFLALTPSLTFSIPIHPLATPPLFLIF